MISDQTKINLSLSKIIVIALSIISASFSIGITYQKIIPDNAKLEEQKKQTEEIGDIKITLARVTTILEHMKEKQDSQRIDISALQSDTSKMNTEVQLISSYVQMDKGKIKKRNINYIE